MKRVLLVLVLMGLVALTGCKNKKKEPVGTGQPQPRAYDMNSGGSVPPPPSSGATVEPVPMEPAPAPAPTATVGGATGGGRVYTVQKGDTLMKIAREQYGSPSRYRDILNANPSITNPNQIKVGQQIVLP